MDQHVSSQPTPVTCADRSPRQAVCYHAGSAAQSNSAQSQSSTPQRREVLLAAPLVLGSLTLWSRRASAITEVKEANIRPELAPDQSRYDAADPDLRDAAALLQKVLREDLSMRNCTVSESAYVG